LISRDPLRATPACQHRGTGILRLPNREEMLDTEIAETNSPRGRARRRH
jgi:hypothetical protein